MAAMSLLLRAGASLGARGLLSYGRSRNRLPLAVSVRHSSGEKRMFVITPSAYYDNRFKSLAMFYILLTGIPVVTFITLVNIFIGEAELVEIPEGYIPEHWEYHKHPITRWLARYVLNPPPEKDYEKTLALLHIEAEKMKLRQDTKLAQKLMFDRGDGPWHFYQTPTVENIDDAPKTTPDF
ncbi:hypothetical protein JRQ81_017766 [Phrynocephalus forsythii]|uniref:NADH dehydrogenase [ubiquinone] 1 beta subcomplex subunit 5, mitochondrial n=1 Tax=Phrynocephalus forsythii TaxID=171643 RepID=A0A9Q1B0H6_9SAUR|nr:hypothetical protein JRQ81_017766 [Phrynocephalus forsythii]